MTDAWISKPWNTLARSLSPDHRPAVPADCSTIVRPAELRAIGAAPSSTQAVLLPSIARDSRIHVVNGTCRINPGGRARGRIEGVERIDQRGEFPASRGCRQHGTQHAGSACRTRAGNFGKMTSLNATPEPGIKGSKAGRHDILIPLLGHRKGRDQRAVELARTEQRFQVGESEGTHIY